MCRKTLPAIPFIMVGLFLLIGVVSTLLSCQRSPPASAPSPTVVGSSPGHLPTTVTDANGRFLFASVSPATHQLYLIESTLPRRWQSGSDGTPVKLALNPGMTVSRQVLPSVVLEARYQDDVISGVVFADLDRDGQMDARDLGLAGVTVVDPNLHHYFVPFYDRDLWQLLSGVNRCQRAGYGDVSDTLESTIALTGWVDGTQWLYDHWEDGYDQDPLNPGPTTITGTLRAGQTQIFRDTVDTTDLGNPAHLQHDGRDRITVAGAAGTVIRMVFPTSPGVVLSTAWEVPEVLEWGEQYIATVGEDLDFNGTFVDDFDYAGLEMMAVFPDTQVYRNGALLATLGSGEAQMILGANDGAGGGGIDSSDVITATAPVQVQNLVGGCGMSLGWSAQGYTLVPLDDWGVNYWAPVPDFTDGANGCNIDLDNNPNDDRDVDIYIHNPHSTELVATLNIPGSAAYPTTPITIPAHSTQSVLGFTGWDDLPPDADNTQAIWLYATDTFWAVAMVDSSSAADLASPNPDNEPRINDWGYSLVPRNDLRSQVVIGWGPGNNASPVPTNNGNMAFVAAITDTVVYVDLDENGTSDAFDMNGDGDALDVDVYGDLAFDEPSSAGGVPLAAGQVLRVGDPNDRRLRGALIYTQDLSHRLAVAWGQDACAVDRDAPYLDLGYTSLPVRIPLLSKRDDLAIDADSSSDIGPGDTLTYTVTFKNSGFGVMSNVVLTDNLPYPFIDFEVGSITSTSPHDSEAYDDGSGTFAYTPTGAPGTADPTITAFRLTWATMGARSTVTITFRAAIQDDIPVGVSEICNFVRVTSRHTEPVDASSCTLATQQQPTPTETATETPTLTVTPTETPTEIPSATPTATPTKRPIETPIATPTATPTDKPIETVTVTATPTEELTPVSPTPQPSETETPVPLVPETGGQSTSVSLGAGLAAIGLVLVLAGALLLLARQEEDQ